jgi:4-diphosphocytidyl-2-C-methyl-D-erythritol kinase
MRTESHALAPAKVNLHLGVGVRREDGFHDLVSVFQAVSLFDALEVRLDGTDGAIQVTGNFDFPASENIVGRAVDVFREETGVRTGVEVRVDKLIPLGAGFGGGSSDAAATLRCLRALLAPDLSAERMVAMAARLGSDVPFFLGAAAALVEGRGERVTPLAPRTDYALAAVVPHAAVGTAGAFAALDALRPREAVIEGAAASLVADYAGLPASAWRFTNSFDTVGMAIPAVAAARDALRGAGAPSPRLTGSGAAVIALFDDPEEARGCIGRVNASAGQGIFLLPLATIPAVW